MYEHGFVFQKRILPYRYRAEQISWQDREKLLLYLGGLCYNIDIDSMVRNYVDLK